MGLDVDILLTDPEGIEPGRYRVVSAGPGAQLQLRRHETELIEWSPLKVGDVIDVKPTIQGFWRAIDGARVERIS